MYLQDFVLPIYTSKTIESTSLGAAILTAYGIGLYSSIKEAAQSMTYIEKKYEPDARNTAIYDKIYKKVYKELFPQIRKSMNALVDLIS